MGDRNKISLKQAQLSIKKFNEIAVPHQLGLLQNHKSNIEKCLALGDWNKIKKEEINALRVVKQLKNLILEMEALRSKIQEDEMDNFDTMISPGRQQALDGIRNYLELDLKHSIAVKSIPTSPVETTSQLSDDLPQIETTFQLQEQQLKARQACLTEFENLQREVKDLHEMFRNINEIVHEQGEKVDVITENAEEALENVVEGEYNLRLALKYKKTFYPVLGAVLGTCVGGPIGLIAGIKAGGLAALGCGVLGYTGGRVLRTDVATGIPEKKNE